MHKCHLQDLLESCHCEIFCLKNIIYFQFDVLPPFHQPYSFPVDTGLLLGNRFVISLERNLKMYKIYEFM